MNPVGLARERAKGVNARIALPEASDERILAAAAMAAREHWAVPVFTGNRDEVCSAACRAGLAEGAFDVYDCTDSALLEEFAEVYVERRGNNMKLGVARRIVSRPLLFAGMLVATGRADGYVAGVAASTATVVEAVELTIGAAGDIVTPSSFMVMVTPEFRGEKDKAFYFADVAVNIDPTARQLAHIGVATARSVKMLFSLEPRVAFLSFSTHGSARHARADKVIEAVAIAREMAGEFAFDGELQADAAIVPETAEHKKVAGSVAGRANVLVFPDLDSANIAYKLVERLAGAHAYGPFLQGLAHPASDLSRGASAEDIASTIAVVAAQCAKRTPAP